ncbi:MAG: Txe/YoeB family addiction module toxin [Bacteroidales bacterium]|nr:Txe/YoeB family addiction module toxin [Bacteroidales bacterium]MCF8458791.1 Txe/YoeB family addiction module toxin [Bacteroidales bacterium]
MSKFVFEEGVLEDYSNWAIVNIKIFKRIVDLLKDIRRTPFKGIGKPEPLKHKRAGYWSRRINHEHRLVYKVIENKNILIVSCRGHYD